MNTIYLAKDTGELHLGKAEYVFADLQALLAVEHITSNYALQVVEHKKKFFAKIRAVATLQFFDYHNDKDIPFNFALSDCLLLFENENETANYNGDIAYFLCPKKKLEIPQFLEQQLIFSLPSTIYAHDISSLHQTSLTLSQSEENWLLQTVEIPLPDLD